MPEFKDHHRGTWHGTVCTRGGHAATRSRSLAVGTVTPRKGYTGADRGAGLAIPGCAVAPGDYWLARSWTECRSRTACVRRSSHPASATGLRCAGAVSATEFSAAAYAAADLFVMASLYEGYGMVLAEAHWRGAWRSCAPRVAQRHKRFRMRRPLKLRTWRFGQLWERRSTALAHRCVSRRQCLSDASWDAGPATAAVGRYGRPRLRNVIKSVALEARQ